MRGGGVRVSGGIRPEYDFEGYQEEARAPNLVDSEVSWVDWVERERAEAAVIESFEEGRRRRRRGEVMAGVRRWSIVLGGGRSGGMFWKRVFRE